MFAPFGKARPKGYQSTMTTIKIAQLTDIHLSPMPAFHPRDWNLKRLTGYVNWHKSRRGVYRPEVLAAIVAHVQAGRPDHIAVTGDLVNIALPEEMERAARWLASLGPPDKVAVIPGNHDLYCDIGDAPGIARWAAYMEGAREFATSGTDAAFPFLRRVGPVALLGVNSALPRPPFVASGEVGPAQRGRLANLLDRTGGEGLIRVIMIHHPPLPGQAPPSRGLDDAAELTALIARHGAELVIHGHNHRTFRFTPGAAGIEIELVAYGLAEPLGPIVELERRILSAPAAAQTVASSSTPNRAVNSE